MSAVRRPVVLAAVVVLLVVVAGVLALVLSDDDGPAFRIGEESGSSSTGEGLMGDRRTARAVVRTDQPADGRRDHLGVELVGPGSRVLDYRVVVLDGDADPVRIRQEAGPDAAEAPGGGGPAARWSGYVATQPADPRATRGGAADARWRRAGADGVVVRPGEQVRLRTRFDVAGGGGRCRRLTVEDGPRWLVRNGDRWRPLRARESDPDRTVVVRTGNVGPLSFRAGGPCSGGYDELVYTGDPDV